MYPAQFFHNFERKIGHEIFVKTEKTEYLSNQLTSAHFDQKLYLGEGQCFLQRGADLQNKRKSVHQVIVSGLAPIKASDTIQKLIFGTLGYRIKNTQTCFLA